jgi:hypothetical protein
MVAIRTKFDGEKIEVPAELRGVGPGDVIVIFNDAGVKSEHSIWDVVGKSPRPRSAEELDAELREERDSWNDR